MGRKRRKWIGIGPEKYRRFKSVQRKCEIRNLGLLQQRLERYQAEGAGGATGRL